jgi:hypothetical protein
MLGLFWFTNVQAQDFRIPITVSNGTTSQVLTLGVSPTATNNNDPTTDVPAPPASPSGFYASLGAPGDEYYTDIRSNVIEEKIYRFNFRFNEQGGLPTGNLTLTWNASVLNTNTSSATLTIGTLAAVDLRTGGSLTLNAATHGSFSFGVIRFTPQLSATPPIITLDKTTLSFTGQTGSNPASQSFAISNTGGGTLTWTASDDASWLALSQVSGTGSGTVTASVNTTGMATGTHNAIITVSGSGVASKTIAVSLTLTAPITYSISGNSGIGGATMTLSIIPNRTISSNVGDANFTFTGIPTGNYTITPSKTGYTFSPASRTVEVNGNLTAQNFTATAVATGALVAYYTCDGNVNDSSGKGNNGIGTNITYAADRFGVANKACSFAGIDNPSHIRVPNHATLQFQNTATIAGYVKLSSLKGMDGYEQAVASGNHCFFAKDHDRGGLFANINNNPASLGIANQNYNSTFNINLVSTINPMAQWFHVAYVIGNNAVKIYINGALVKTEQATINLSVANTKDIYWGKYSDQWYPFNGLMDDLRVYNYALSDAEIAALYQPAVANQPPIVANVFANQSLAIGGGTFSRNLTAAPIVFTDANNDVLTFTTTSSNTTIATATISGTALTVTPVAAGTATITVTANDGKGGTVNTSFTVTITAPVGGLVAYYTCDGNTNDSSGNGFNGIVNNVTFGTDRQNQAGKACVFGGSGSQIKATFDTRASQTDITLMGWVQLSAGGDNNPRLIQVGGIGGSWSHYGLHVEGTGATRKINFMVCPSTSSCEVIQTGTTLPVSTSNWYFVAATLKGKLASIYINGVWEGSKTFINSFTPFQSALLQLGYSDNGLDRFAGRLDEVRIYSKAYTETELKSVYNTEKPSYIGELMAYYPFNGNANDASGKGNHGTVNGATLTTDRFGVADKAYSFDGIDDWINTSYTQANLNAYTISAWVKAEALQDFIIAQNRGDENARGRSITLSYTKSAKAWNFSADGDNLMIGQSANFDFANKWVQIVGVWDATNSQNFDLTQFKIYIDGNLASSSPQYVNGPLVSTGTPLTGQNNLMLGRHVAWKIFSKGSLDDVRIYSKALNSTEVKALYDAEKPQSTGIVEELFSTADALNNWAVQKIENNGWTYKIVNGTLELETQGGSNGYYGKGEVLILKPTYTNLPANFNGKEIEINIKELLMESVGGKKENITFSLLLSNESGSEYVSIGLHGRYSGYSPINGAYNVYNKHSLHVSSNIEYSWINIEELPLDQYFNYELKLTIKDGVWTLFYKKNNETAYKSVDITNKVPVNLRGGNVKPSIQVSSGDGGETTQNGKGKYQVDRFIIRDIGISTNQAPTAKAQSVSTNEDVVKAITLEGTDPEGQALTYTIATQPSKGTLSGNAPNLTYTPNKDVNGTDSFTFTVKDGTNTSTPATVSITITAVNDAPTCTAVAAQNLVVGTSKSITLACTDADGDTIAFGTPTSSATNVATVSILGNTLTVVPIANGSSTISLPVGDGKGGTVTATVSITVSNTLALSVTPVKHIITAGSTSISSTITITNGTGTPVCSTNVTWVTITSCTPSQVSATITANTGSIMRTGTISVSVTGATGSPVSVSIEQAGVTATPTLTISPDIQSVSYNAGSTTFAITTTNTVSVPTCEVSVGKDWITGCTISGQTLTVNYSANTGNERVGGVTVLSIGATGSPKIVQLRQAAYTGSKVAFTLSTMSGKVGETILYPINISQVTDLSSARFTLNFDATRIQILGYEKTSLTQNTTLVENTTKVGEYQVSMVSVSSITGQGALVNLKIKLLSSGDVNMTASNVQLNGGSIPITVTNGKISIVSFTCGDSNKDGVVNGLDAVTILRYDVGLISGNTIDLLAADTDGNGIVNGLDAVTILKYDVGLVSLTDFKCKVMGEVLSDISSTPNGNGEEIPIYAKSTTEYTPLLSSSFTDVAVSLPKTSCKLNEQIMIPITVSDLTGQQVTAAKFKVSFDPSILKIVDVQTTGTLTDQSLMVNNTPLGQGYSVVSLASANDWKGTGAFIKLKAECLQNGTSNLQWESFIFNSGTPKALTQNGSIQVSNVVSGNANLIGFLDTNPQNGDQKQTSWITPMQVNGIIPVEIHVSKVQNIKGAQFSIVYDTRDLDFDSFTAIGKNGEPNFLTQGGGKIFTPFVSQTPQTGTTTTKTVIAIVLDSNSQDKLVSGDGLLGVANFKIKSTFRGRNATPMKLTEIAVVNSDGSQENVVTASQITFMAGLVANENKNDLPFSFALHHAYPNPFNPSTNLSFDLPMAAMVRAEIFDMTGRKVWENTETMMSAGVGQTITLNAQNWTSGVYLCKLTARNGATVYSTTGKITLLK